MINPTFKDAFTPEWVSSNINDQTRELVVLRKTVPWQKIIDGLVSFYDQKKGAVGISLRIIIALFLIKHLRRLSDRNVVERVKENRYIQYFCNVPDDDLQTFIHPSSLSKIRRRLGVAGAMFIESEIFNVLRSAGVIKNDAALIDSTVLPANILYPTDIGLVFKAFGKMEQFAKRHSISPWWDEKEVKSLFREYNLNKDKNKIHEYILEFGIIFFNAMRIFEDKFKELPSSETENPKDRELLDLLKKLEEQNEQKIAGEAHIKDRIVSLDNPEVRPIKKGKKHPSCEFGTTLQLSFNRQGFMVTAENFIGKPNDKTLWSGTAALFIQRMNGAPEYAVGDQGYRSQANMSIPKDAKHIFLGKSDDVAEEEKDYCRKARSATEGFIAVAKNLRGFGSCLYKGFTGDRIWTLLCQAASHLKKFSLLYDDDEIEEENLIKLGFA